MRHTQIISEVIHGKKNVNVFLTETIGGVEYAEAGTLFVHTILFTEAVYLLEKSLMTIL